MTAEIGPGIFGARSPGAKRLSCDMAVHPFHRIGSGERETACRHFVQRDTQRVKITARIDGAIHSSGLFRCHVGECSGDELGSLGRLALAGKARSNPKARQPNLTGRGFNQNIGRLDVFVNQMPFVYAAECRCGANGEPQEPQSSPAAARGPA